MKKQIDLKENNRRFFIALLTVVIFEVILKLLQTSGSAVIKVGITILVWTSCFLAISTFIFQYKKIKADLPKYALYLFFAVMGWNLFNILRSVFYGTEPTATLLGNYVTSLSLLVPFSISFSADKSNLRTISKFFIGLIIFGIPALFLFLVAKGSSNVEENKAFLSLFYGVFFLIPIIPFQSAKDKMIIIVGSCAMFYLAIITGYRINNIRIPMLYSCILAMYFYKWFKLRIIFFIAILSLALPFYLIMESVETGESAFEKYSPQSDDDLSTDTRTFLYTEVYEDLRRNKDLVIGKGSTGSYYSPYFEMYEGDSPHRLTVETGILAILLKGGYIAVFLNLAIFFIAIYLALFKTNNYLIIGLGLMLIIHVLILFISNYIAYSIYNVALWFFVGICLSKEMRALNNIEIKNLLLNGSIA